MYNKHRYDAKTDKNTEPKRKIPGGGKNTSK